MSLSRFDVAIVGVAALLISLTTLVILMSTQVGLEIVGQIPGPEAAVSTKSQIRITFDDMLDSVPETAIILSPPVTGTTTIVGDTLIFQPAFSFAPDVSYAVTLSAGVTGEAGRSLKEAHTWQFRTLPPRILYLQPDENGQDQLVMANPHNAEMPKQLTHFPLFVLDFAVSPDSSQIAFSAPVGEEGQKASSNLWLLNMDGSEPELVLNCTDAACSRPVWMPDGRRILYERRHIPVPGAFPGNPRLWWFNVFSGATTPVFADSQILGSSATVSPDGKWFSFIGSTGQLVQLYNIENGSTITVPNRTGFTANWNPQSQVIALADIINSGDLWSTALSTFSIGAQEYQPLTEGFEWDDINPVWSSGGGEIAFARRPNGSTLRSQIWLIQVESGAANPLTADTDFHHSAFTWSADGVTILYLRDNLTEQPGVWIIDIATGQKTEIASPATQPAWLP